MVSSHYFSNLQGNIVLLQKNLKTKHSPQSTTEIISSNNFVYFLHIFLLHNFLTPEASLDNLPAIFMRQYHSRNLSFVAAQCL